VVGREVLHLHSVRGTRWLMGWCGRRRVLDDYVLDYPNAKKQFKELQEHGLAKGWLQDTPAAAAPAPAAT
jgi:hypothetical protein